MNKILLLVIYVSFSKSAFSQCLCKLNEHSYEEFLQSEDRGLLLDVPSKKKTDFCIVLCKDNKINNNLLDEHFKKSKEKGESYNLLELAYHIRIKEDQKLAVLYLQKMTKTLNENKTLNAKKAYCVLILMRCSSFYDKESFDLVPDLRKEFDIFYKSLTEKGLDSQKWSRLDGVEKTIIDRVNNSKPDFLK